MTMKKDEVIGERDEALSGEAPEKLIFVVEDDAANAEMLALLITQELSCRVQWAKDGTEALAMLDEVQPTVFLFDYSLPMMNGLELYDRLRMKPGLESVPALFLSAGTHREDVERRHLPFLEKPFELENVLTQLRNLLAG